jgi:hypothetical protein
MAKLHVCLGLHKKFGNQGIQRESGKTFSDF